MELELRRRFFAEELEAVYRLRSPALVEALATVPRERFLPPGPWTVLVQSVQSDVGMGGVQTRVTADADPARVCHNIGVAIDASRQLFNGHPGTIAPWLDALELTPGGRVLHVGCGLGYYTALVAHVVAPTGRVVAYEADTTLATGAREQLASYPWVDVRCGDASGVPEGRDDQFDGILVNAGLSHPPGNWLDAMATGGRAMFPLTSTLPGMGNIGKGPVVMLTRRSAAEFTARVVGFVAIYTAVGLRDEQMNRALGQALMGGPMRWQTITRLRRDAHEATASCWLHGPSFCLSA